MCAYKKTPCLVSAIVLMIPFNFRYSIFFSFLSFNVHIIIHSPFNSSAASKAIFSSFSNVLIIMFLSLLYPLSLYTHSILSDQSECFLLSLYLTDKYYSFYAWVILESFTLSCNGVSIMVRALFSLMCSYLNSLYSPIPYLCRIINFFR